jgi:hypothetical protein
MRRFDCNAIPVAIEHPLRYPERLMGRFPLFALLFLPFVGSSQPGAPQTNGN